MNLLLLLIGLSVAILGLILLVLSSLTLHTHVFPFEGESIQFQFNEKIKYYSLFLIGAGRVFDAEAILTNCSKKQTLYSMSAGHYRMIKGKISAETFRFEKGNCKEVEIVFQKKEKIRALDNPSLLFSFRSKAVHLSNLEVAIVEYEYPQSLKILGWLLFVLGSITTILSLV